MPNKLRVLLASIIAAAITAASGQARADSDVVTVVSMAYPQENTGRFYSHLYLYAEDGTLLRQLTNDEGVNDMDPFFAADGRTIVFVRAKQNQPNEFWSIEPEGARLQKLTSAPDWYQKMGSALYFKRQAANAWKATGTFQPADYSFKISVREEPGDEEDHVNGPGHGKHYLLEDVNAGSKTEFGALGGFEGAYEMLATNDNAKLHFYLAPKTKVAFFSAHLNDTEGDTCFALDLNHPRFVRLAPGWATPISSYGLPGFFTLTEETCAVPGTDKTTGCGYLERWDENFNVVRYAREGSIGICQAACVYRKGMTPAVLPIRAAAIVRHRLTDSAGTVAQTQSPRQSVAPAPEPEGSAAPRPAPVPGNTVAVAPSPSATPDPAAIRADIVSLVAQLHLNPNNEKKTVTSLNIKFSQLGKNLDATMAPACVELVKAAEHAKMWQAMLLANHWLRVANPKFGRPAWAARAMIGLGNNKGAAAFLMKIGQAFPPDPEVDLWRADGQRHLGQWGETEKSARAALQKHEQYGRTLATELLALAHYELYDALLWQGKIDAAEGELKNALGLEPEDKTYIHGQRVIANGRLHQFIYSRIYQENIPLGIYHLYRSDGTGLAGSVVSLKFLTLTPKARSVQIEASIPGFTDTVTKTVFLVPGNVSSVHLSPPLKTDISPTTLRAETPAQIVFKMVDPAKRRNPAGRLLSGEAFALRHAAGGG